MNDPSSDPQQFPTDADQETERRRLFELLERLCRWDATNDQRVLDEARAEVSKSVDGELPLLIDPFGGRGSIPLEAARLGLSVGVSDLNPVAVLIAKCLLEVPTRFRSHAATHPGSDERLAISGGGLTGLLEDLRRYGADVQQAVSGRLSRNYPDSVHGPVSSYLWARTAPCQNPGCRALVPLVTSFVLSKKKGREAWVEPCVHADGNLTFEVRGRGEVPAPTKTGRGAQFRCLKCGTITDDAYIKQAGQHDNLGYSLMCGVVNTRGKREYVSSDSVTLSEVLDVPEVDWLEQAMPDNPRWFSPPAFGLKTYRTLFTDRQLIALTAIQEAIRELRPVVEANAIAAGFDADDTALCDGGCGTGAYSEAVVTYLACALSRLVDYSNSLATWNASNENVRNLFQRQAIPIVWDFAEVNIATGPFNFASAVEWICESLTSVPPVAAARVAQLDAASTIMAGPATALVCTDPPYYDNIGYADLSDFFYVWLRPLLREVYPDMFSTLLTPKRGELVATPYRFQGSKDAARRHFQEGLEAAFGLMRGAQNPDFPVAVFYAFKQEESDGDAGTASTGWETMLEGLIRAGLSVMGTWPMRTTKSARSVARGTNALASAIVLVCRPRPATAPLATRKSFVADLRAELPPALKALQHGQIAPVDLAQAAIGPGIGVFSRCSRVVEANGETMAVRTALALINEAVDMVLNEQEGEFDAETRWAIGWYDQFGFSHGSSGEANLLCNAKNTALNALEEAGIIATGGGSVRLLRGDELDSSWTPETDERLTVWEVLHHLIRTLEGEGELAVAALLQRLGGVADSALMLSYRLYTICQRRQRPQEALAYNGLAVVWSELAALAVAGVGPSSRSTEQLEL